MKYRYGWVAIVVSMAVALSACGSREAPKPDYVARGQQDWEHVKLLADDAMEGRRAGTPGHRRAAEYVANQFEAAGLAPGGDDGYFQRVNLESRTIREDLSSLALVTPRGVEPLKLGDDAVISLRGNFAGEQVEAPIVFVGHGLRLPQFGHDDLAGVDLKGKIVAYFTSAPKSVPGAAGAHFGSASERWKEYRAAGAVGVLTIPNPYAMDLPWERSAAARTNPTMRLAAPATDLFTGQQVWAGINPARFARLLEGTGQSEKDLLATLEKGEALPHFDLKVRLRAKTTADISTVVSENVVGVLPGSDESLAGEYVALSAHLDHLGISEKGEGDRLNNGAIDNASGVASLIETARRLHAAGLEPKRSIVFVAVTAEESGLLGSRAYAENAASSGMNIVANINSDMYMPIYPLKQLIVFGLDESSLGEDARVVAAGLGIEPIVDPQPQRNRFIRSDQYSFIRTGVPALSLKIGFAPGSPEEEIDRQWFKDRYHSPSDDLSQPVDFAAMGLYGEFLQRLALRVADAAQVPAWHETSVFATIK